MAAPRLLRGIPDGIFTLFFPDDCRICERPLDRWTRVPVCADCLAAPKPLEADYFCASCNTPFLNPFPLDENGLCAACRAGLRGFDRAASFGFYEGELRDLIHLFKYSGMKPLGRYLAKYLERALSVDEAADKAIDAVVPVPLHWRKRWQRGFNQSEILARAIAKSRRIPLVNALRRARSTSVQAGLGKTARRRNVSGAFIAKPRAGPHGSIDGKRILLVDDVMTTGATATACGLALKRAGAKSVSLLTLARVDRRWRT